MNDWNKPGPPYWMVKWTTKAKGTEIKRLDPPLTVEDAMADPEVIGVVQNRNFALILDSSFLT